MKKLQSLCTRRCLAVLALAAIFLSITGVTAKAQTSGAGSINVLHYTDGRQPDVLPTMISTSMRYGQRIYHQQPGGGGFGNPLKRAPELVAEDVRNERVSLQAAQKFYGVVLRTETKEVDTLATAALRAKRLREGSAKA